jgi:hypothetical protein
VQPTDRVEFVTILNGLSLSKPGGARLLPEALTMWWNSMQDWSIEDFRAAANHLARSVEFMPSQYHFDQLRKAGQPTSGEAFERARQIVRRLFPREYASHQSGDARLDAAVRACGGYEALAMCTTENIGYFERRFAEHFESISDAEAVREVLPDLTGGMRLSGPHGASIALRRIGRA